MGAFAAERGVLPTRPARLRGFHETQRITASNLISEVERQRDIMVSVAPGGPRIDTVNGDYTNRRDLIRMRLQEPSLGSLKTFEDLWEWYGRWSNGELPSYRLRRSFIRELWRPANRVAEPVTRDCRKTATRHRDPNARPKLASGARHCSPSAARCNMARDV